MLSTHTGVNQLKLVLLILTAMLGGCANTEWLHSDQRYGYKPWDLCVRCGEKIMLIPNHPFEAQIRRANGETW